MEPTKYRCRFCGKEISGFSCDCQRSKDKLMWDKHERIKLREEKKQKNENIQIV